MWKLAANIKSPNFILIVVDTNAQSNFVAKETKTEERKRPEP